VAKYGKRDPNFEFGTNPCSEIILRPYQFCNLTEVMVRPEDTLESLKQKVRMAAILGTIQATFTHFPYLRKVWQRNTEEERLLGVSLTGIYDHKVTSNPDGAALWLPQLRLVAEQANAEYADLLGIPYEQYTQGGLFPIAYTKGTDFKLAKRLPAEQLTHWDTW
jgi:ribonucleoside-diphosphate reductase alpha chain